MPPETRAQTGSLPEPSSSNKQTSSTSTSSQPQTTTTSQPRHRPNAKHAQIFKSATNDAEPSDSNDPLALPRFTIDLSLPPEQRYLEVCAALQDEMRGLEALFDEVVGSFVPWMPIGVLRWVCWGLLSRVKSEEETAELKGISKATGIDMYLLICFNVILDLLMGCSSGGAAVRDETSTSPGSAGTKMVHFRTLDWGMDPLRRVLVQLDYVLEPHGDIVASSINYAGFVGVLTGVRKSLSLSLNFRGVHNGSGELVANARYYGYLGMVFLGLRPSISSTLRSYLIPGGYGKNLDHASIKSLPDFETVVEEMSCKTNPLTSTACYLCFTSGRETAVIEKDLNTATLRSSTSFTVVTNADVKPGKGGDDAEAGEEGDDVPLHPEAKAGAHDASSPANALEELLEDANERKACAERNYRNLVRRGVNAKPGNPLPTTDDIVEMVQQYPTSNECTHFAAVMDPTVGKFAWCRFWRRPIEC